MGTYHDSLAWGLLPSVPGDQALDADDFNDAILALMRQRSMGALSRVEDLANAGFGVAAHPASGQLILVGSTTHRFSPRGQLDTTGSTTTHPGSPTFSGRTPSATDGDELTLVANGGNSYRTNSSGVLQAAVAFATITTVHDLIWAEGLSRFVAVGEDSSGEGAVEYSTDGSAWTEWTAAAWTDGGYRFVAHDGDQALLVGCEYGSSDSRLAYTANGGTAWSVVDHQITGSNFQTAGLAYDATRSLWLITDYDTDDLYQATDPSGANWTKVCDLPSTYGLDLVCVGDVWLVACDGTQGGSSSAAVYYSRDAGTTWAGLGIGGKSTAGHMLGLADGRAVLGEGFISEVFA